MTEELESFLERVQQNPTDERALRGLFAELSPPVTRWAYKLTGDVSWSTELCHDAFSKFYVTKSYLKTPSADKALDMLRRIVRNLVNDHYRSRPRRFVSDHEFPIENIADETSGPDDDRGSQEADTDLERLAREWDLDADEKELLALLCDRQPINSIAATLGISYSTAATRIHRLRKKIRRRW